MICLESLGVFSDAPGSQMVPPEFAELMPDPEARGNFIAIVGNDDSLDLVAAFVKAFRKDGRVPPLGASLPQLAVSDHWGFWECGYPAIMLTDTAMLRNPHYHAPTDLPEHLNMPRWVPSPMRPKPRCGISSTISADNQVGAIRAIPMRHHRRAGRGRRYLFNRHVSLSSRTHEESAYHRDHGAGRIYLADCSWKRVTKSTGSSAGRARSIRSRIDHLYKRSACEGHAAISPLRRSGGFAQNLTRLIDRRRRRRFITSGRRAMCG